MIEVIFKVILAITSLAFVLFVPGFLLSLIILKDLDKLERIVFSICLSVCILIFLGLFLGFNETMANITGGITAWNLWICMIGISLALFLIYMMKRNKSRKVYKQKIKF